MTRSLVACLSRLALASVGVTGCNSIIGINEPLGIGGGYIDVSTQGQGGRTGGTGGTGGMGGTTAPMPSDAGSTADLRWAEWPMPNPPVGGLPNTQSYDTSLFIGVVIDSITGLQWQQSVDANSYTWADAFRHCDELTLNGGGWRVPSRIELTSIVDYTRQSPIIDTDAFPDTPSDYFWTASEFAGDPAFAWRVNFKFADGMVDKNSMTSAHRVRCVR